MFKSYGVKIKSTSQYTYEHGLPRPDSAHYEAVKVTRRQVCGPCLPKTLLTDVASLYVHCFGEAGSYSTFVLSTQRKLRCAKISPNHCQEAAVTCTRATASTRERAHALEFDCLHYSGR